MIMRKLGKFILADKSQVVLNGTFDCTTDLDTTQLELSQCTASNAAHHHGINIFVPNGRKGLALSVNVVFVAVFHSFGFIALRIHNNKKIG